MYLIIALGAFVLDRATKILAALFVKSKGVEIIKGVFRLTFTKNTGAAFSMLSNNTDFLIIFTSLLILGVVVYSVVEYKNKANNWEIYGLALILGGALGNLVDRIMFGFVVDFLDFYLIGFAIFNVADICICVGCCMFIFGAIITERDKKRNTIEELNAENLEEEIAEITEYEITEISNEEKEFEENYNDNAII